jgi:hypothetical protein
MATVEEEEARMVTDQKSGTTEQKRSESLRFRQVDPAELLSEEHVLCQDEGSPFQRLKEYDEPAKSYFIAWRRLEPIFKKEQVYSPLLVETPRGRGLLWRLWRNQVGVVLLKSSEMGKRMEVEDKVTFLTPDERANIILVLDCIVLNPPKWS